ncbi:uncharacterized protein ZBIST_4799 [Zygosaccharomyces bailii]|uniref:ZYBA0S17-00936g1_1 n=1 Tax=Zygosaccharomyces bailii (strain CLIB 213 / ATCC 58445 / CBS 680 / BCRC 21525 / NBRC 1098 / NCYC 1416 / NRRL Y-2227) TaxID=1333698 RepID=A0A8J2XB32_ZYGB2|nr:ZYBA0S17-00936g1_1 [Zygosaccharomyces bailii CLIB 213]SJM88610.1 uncharacterized protein ZBIST_4799 [Zygosaccharomyces bailii]
MTFRKDELIKIWNHPVTEYLKGKWFFYCLAIFILLAHFFPEFAADDGMIRGQYSIGYGAVACIFLNSGLNNKTKRLMAEIARWRAHVTVILLSFFITSSIVFGFCAAIKKSHNKNIDEWVLIGFLLMAASPTTVASNVMMTSQAGGNDLLCLCEVFIGNMLGAFVTPGVIQLFTDSPLFKYGNPANGSSVRDVYRRVLFQVGLTVFVPLATGQIIQNILPKPTQMYTDFLKRYHIKIGAYMLLLIMFNSFSTAFKQHAFTSVSHACIIFVCFFDLGLYLFFTLICFFAARCYLILLVFTKEPVKGESSWLYYYSYKIFRPFYYNKRDTVCLCYCGPAKTAALGVSLVTSQYGNEKTNLGKMLLPLVLYQAIQVLTASLFIPLFKWWLKDEIEEGQGKPVGDLEMTAMEGSAESSANCEDEIDSEKACTSHEGESFDEDQSSSTEDRSIHASK